MATIKLCSEGF